MRFRLMLGAACTCFLASPTLAADLSGPRRLPPPPPPGFDADVAPSQPPLWQGIYWGLSGGYGWGDSDGSFDTFDSGTDPEGYLGSATIGYNMLLGSNLLLGIEGDLGVMDISADDEELGGGQVYRTSFGPWWGTLRGRAGFALGPLLLYGTGGLAFASLDDVSVEFDGDEASDSELRAGWTVGGGAEFAFSDTVSAKAEYLHMDFGSTDGVTSAGQSFTFDNQVDVVRAGLNFRFR